MRTLRTLRTLRIMRIQRPMWIQRILWIQWLDLLRFEWRYQTRRPAFFALAGVFFACGFALAATAFGPPDVPLNAPFAVAQSTALASLLTVIAASFFCAQAALRDPEHRMSEIIFATACTRSQFLFSRYLGLVAALGSAFLCVSPGLLVGTHLVTHDAEQVVPLLPFAYLGPLLVFGLPNVLFVGAVLFAVALASRSAVATYVGGVIGYLLYFVTALFSGSPLMANASPPSERGLAIAALADPFGMSALFASTRYWTAAERAERTLDLSGVLLGNRLSWLAVTALVLTLVHRRFAFRLPTGEQRLRGSSRSGRSRWSGRWWRSRRAKVSLPGGREEVPPPALAHSSSLASAPSTALAPDRLPTVRPDDGPLAVWSTFASTLGRELHHALGGWPLPALLVGWVAMLAIELAQTFRHAEFATALVPTTALVLGELATPLALFGVLLVVYWAAELVWRERVAGMAEIVDATPVASGALLAAKLVALAGLVVLLALVGIATAVTFQLASGVRPEPLVYLGLLLFVGLPLVLVAVLAVLVQTLVANRSVGILVSIVLVLVWHRGLFGGPQHPLLRYAGLPAVPYSDLAGWAPDLSAFLWLGAYWCAFALLLAALAAACWRRGVDTGWAWRKVGKVGPLSLRVPVVSSPWRFRAHRTKAGGGRLRWAVWGVALVWIGLGGSIFRQTNGWNVYRTADELEAWKASYERTYRSLETVPQPVPVAIELELDLYPEGDANGPRRYEVRGRSRLVNKTAAPIDTVWVTLRRGLAKVELRLAGREAVAYDPSFATSRFVLDPPLAPGASTDLDFAFLALRRGVVAGAAERDVVANGSFLLSHQILPTLGYRQGYELADEAARRRQGLPPLRRVVAPLPELGGEEGVAAGPWALTTTVTTPADQVAIAPGDLVASGERNGRRFFRYHVPAARSSLVAFAAGRWRVARRDHAGIALEVYVHPGHERNVDAMLAAAARSLDHGRRAFGPYPYTALRIVELPATSPLASRGTGFAAPGTVFLLEDSGFLTDRRDPGRIDVVSKRIAHEVAHQWWGHQVSPLPGPGASTLVESLARSTELRVLAELHGEAAVAPVLGFELDRYLRGRAGGEEPPLSTVADEGYVFYAKGALVLAAIRDLVGDEVVDRALRSLVDQVQTSDRQPTAADLLAALAGETCGAGVDRPTVSGAVEPPATTAPLAAVPPSDRPDAVAPAAALATAGSGELAGAGEAAARCALIADWWNGVVLYDLQVLSARATPGEGGRAHLELALAARRSDHRGGVEKALPLDESIELAVYANDPGVSGWGDPPLQVERVRLRGDQTLTFEVDAAARFVLIDPRILRIDRNRADNLRSIAWER